MGGPQFLLVEHGGLERPEGGVFFNKFKKLSFAIFGISFEGGS